MTVQQISSISNAIDSSKAPVTLAAINPHAAQALLERAVVRSEGKLVSNKPDQKMKARANIKVFNALLFALRQDDVPMNAACKAAARIGKRETSNNLSRFLQDIVQDLFWTYKGMASQTRRAEQQVSKLAEDDDSSVSEIERQMMEDAGMSSDQLLDYDSMEVEAYTVDDLEAALIAIRHGFGALYVQIDDTLFDVIPFVTKGSMVGTTIDNAMTIADSIIDDMNQMSRAKDNDILR